ncbi:hypothetical protein [Paracoccus xiamenensis]|uniref:hypothetical protein n=1 Tax=Paracoccus xiamenensis TaxID=2714901 RepID=UPI00140886E6|nr:hypothetical protein [Paracoccus xiamenensis]NHF72838.1 hypothetical protein [Paracoccus xiamenensis]
MMIANEQQFRDAVADKPMVRGGDEIVVNAAGQIVGTLDGKAITASKWMWDGSTFCRALQTAERDFPSACQNVTMDGREVTFGQTTWTLK